MVDKPGTRWWRIWDCFSLEQQKAWLEMTEPCEGYRKRIGCMVGRRHWTHRETSLANVEARRKDVATHPCSRAPRADP